MIHWRAITEDGTAYDATTEIMDKAYLNGNLGPLRSLIARIDNEQAKRDASRVNAERVPLYAVLTMAFFALLITLPALKGKSSGEAVPFAFFAVVSVCVIGLYIAYVIPIFLRWRKGDAFQTGPWNNGRKYKWMNSFATLWVVLITIIFCLPFTPAAVPWNSEFTWEALNYAPLTVGVVILFAAITWLVSARKHFAGQVREIDLEKEIGPVPEVGPAAP